LAQAILAQDKETSRQGVLDLLSCCSLRCAVFDFWSGSLFQLGGLGRGFGRALALWVAPPPKARPRQSHGGGYVLVSAVPRASGFGPSPLVSAPPFVLACVPSAKKGWGRPRHPPLSLEVPAAAGPSRGRASDYLGRLWPLTGACPVGASSLSFPRVGGPRGVGSLGLDLGCPPPLPGAGGMSATVRRAPRTLTSR